MAVLAVGAVASTGPAPAPQARRASHRLLARPQALPVAIQWPVVRGMRPYLYLYLIITNKIIIYLSQDESWAEAIRRPGLNFIISC